MNYLVIVKATHLSAARMLWNLHQWASACVLSPSRPGVLCLLCKLFYGPLFYCFYFIVPGILFLLFISLPLFYNDGTIVSCISVTCKAPRAFSKSSKKAAIFSQLSGFHKGSLRHLIFSQLCRNYKEIRLMFFESLGCNLWFWLLAELLTISMILVYKMCNKSKVFKSMCLCCLWSSKQKIIWAFFLKNHNWWGNAAD